MILQNVGASFPWSLGKGNYETRLHHNECVVHVLGELVRTESVLYLTETA